MHDLPDIATVLLVVSGLAGIDATARKALVVLMKLLLRILADPNVERVSLRSP